MTTDNIEMWNIERITPYIRNPVVHPDTDVAKMAGLLTEFGCRPPLLIQREGAIIVDGHLRYLAALKLGWDIIPVILCDNWTHEQVKAYRITSRNSATWAKWDEQLLELEVSELKNTNNFNVDLLGFNDGFFDKLTSWDSDQSLKEGEEGEPIVTRAPIVKNGDLFQLGQHRLLCGDCTNPENVNLLMDGHNAQMIFSDPPFNLSARTISTRSIHQDFSMGHGEMSSEQFIEFLINFFRLNIKHSIDGSIHYIFMDWRHIYEISVAGLATYGSPKQLAIWAKDVAGMGSFYRSQHELVFIFKNGNGKHINNIGLTGKRTNVWKYPAAMSFANKKTGNGAEHSDLNDHPTPKPVAMAIDAIFDCSKNSQIILDLFLGSGTTLIAAERTGRKCFGMDINNTYVENTIRRWYRCVENNTQVKFKHLNGHLELQQILDKG